MQLNEKDQIVCGVLRYLMIPFEKKYKSILSSSTKIILFGDIIPSMPL